MKKAIAIMLTVVFITAVFWTANPTIPVYAEEYRSGFLLTPVQYDSTGISTDTGFILKTEEEETMDRITEMTRMLGDYALQITQKGPKEFLLTPEKELLPNKLYTFTITPPGKETVSWTFQTRRDFSVLGTLPAHQSSYVPVNSGVEIYFSHMEFGDLQKYFEISPKTEGRFERNGYSAVFIPKKLEPGTIYTVTIKKGLPLKGTEQKLSEDSVFAFETEPKPEQSIDPKTTGSLYFRNMLMEFATDEAPLIPIGIYAGKNTNTDAVVKTSLYQYKSCEDFIEALKTKYEQPYWAYTAQDKKLLPKEGLMEVASFDQSFDLAQWQERYLSVPEALSNGFYLVESTYNDLTVQMLIQSTDLSAFFTDSDTQTLIWVNSLKNKKPVADARVTDSLENRSYTTNTQGIASFGTAVTEPDEKEENPLHYYRVKKGDNEVILIRRGYEIYRYNSSTTDHYWRYFQTDRNLYKPDDPVQFWGFLQNRYDETAPETITVEIAEGNYWGFPEAKFLSYFLPSIQKPLVTVDVSADNGFFEGGFRLPKLSPGGYRITVKVDDEVINSHYIQIENYVKPAYTMTVEKDKNAIFLGETVNFTVIPSFFDGTALPSLDISYHLGGYPFQEKSDTLKTGTDGKLTIPFTAKTDNAAAQGAQYVWLNAHASLPESGMIQGSQDVRVFLNDIHGAFYTEADGKGNITLKATLNEIVLDRLNHPETDVPPDTSDFLGDPVAYKTIAGTILYHHYEKIEDGEEYDYINKVVQKRYRYEERREKVTSFSFRTGEDGIAEETFALEHPNEGWYTAELIWNDNCGRIMSRKVSLSNRRYIPTPEIQNDWYHLESDRDKYRLDDEVTAIVKNNDETVSTGSFLFIESQKGIQKYAVQEQAEYKTTFTKDRIPNFYVSAVCFTGRNYVRAGNLNIRYDTDEVKIDITAQADKPSYRPGDTVTLNITAKDENGTPVSAYLNLAAIDEAMLAISGYNVNVLSSLYQWLGDGLGHSDSSHKTSPSALNLYGTADTAAEATPAAKMAVTRSSGAIQYTAATETAMDMDEVRVRSEFKDTAVFRLIPAGEDGTATVSFVLPDNVTSWRVYLAGISSDLYGGTGEADIKVTLPFFVNDSLNTTYLSGDFPSVGVSGYGNDLAEGERINWQITSPQNPDYLGTASGKAFERVNIPLWELKEGVYDLAIKAVTENGLSDGVQRTIHVTDTYHEVEKAVTEPLKANMRLTGGEEGLTTLIVTDTGRGRLVPPLYGLLYSGGSRLDQKYTAFLAKQRLHEMAPGAYKPYHSGEVDLAQYQNPDGGFGILPYAESDVELSALLATQLKDEPGSGMLRQYFYSLIFSEPGRINTPALYGLAVMGEPVLVDLNKALAVQNLTLRDSIYLALAFDMLHESHIAQTIYHQRIQPVLEEKSPYIRVVHSDDADGILRDTALAAVLASRLDTPDKDGLFRYITDHASRKVLVNVEKLLYILHESPKLSDADVTFTYEYDGNTYTETLKHGGAAIVTIPSVKLSDMIITKVSGDACVVSVFKAPLSTGVKPDENLKVKRTYYNYTTGEASNEFRHNDIVKVVLDWDVFETAMDGHYEIIDFAPSGLKPITSPYQAGIRPDRGTVWWFRNTDGQKVTFNVYRDSKTKNPLVYYARVVSPGTFKADRTLMQGTLVKDSMQFGESAAIEISE